MGSETSLGYSKLSELLRDAYLSDLCTVELRQTGYVMIPRPEAFISERSENDITASFESDTCVVPENYCGTGMPPRAQSAPEALMKALSPKRSRPQMMEDFDENAQAESAVETRSQSNPLFS